MKVLVTGGAGFVGSHVVEHLAKTGDEVVAFDNLSRSSMLGKSTGDQAVNVDAVRSAGARFVKGDVRDLEVLKGAATGRVDAIVHTAAQVAVTTSLNDPRADFEVNTTGTFNILELARMNDASVVFTSTNKVYGDNVNGIDVKEGVTRYEFSDPRYASGIPEGFSIDRTHHSPYGASKLAADLYVQEYAKTYGLKTGVFRMSCIYGDRQFGVEDQGWVSWFGIAVQTGRPITIYGDGKQVRDVLFIDDLIRAIDLMLSSNRSGVYNIGGGPSNTLSLLELLAMLEEITGRKPKVRYDEWRPADQRVYISNITRARKDLIWTPSIAPREGVTRMLGWVKDHFER